MDKEDMNANKTIRKPLLIISAFLLSILILIGGVLLFYTLMEYRPDKVEELNIHGFPNKELSKSDEIDLISWNVGYLALGEKSDFFMDGGKMVRGFSKADIENNLSHVIEELGKTKADIFLLQEVDKNSYRSFSVDEVEALRAAFSGFESSYARNFKTIFVPYPFPPIRNVDAGVFTLSSYDVRSAQRVTLPSPFKWPVKTVNLKRCLLVNRLPLKDSDKEVVIVNLHLEAYDETGGALAQLNFMLDFMKNEYEKGNYVIAGGDFNQTFSTIKDEEYHNYEEGLWKPGKIKVEDYKEFSFLMDGKHPSCRSLHKPYTKDKEFPHYIIDGFIITKNVELIKLETIQFDFRHSDHNPIRLKVKLK